jgi:AraC-like DNA-binding protein
MSMRIAAPHQMIRLRPGLELRSSDGPHAPHVDVRRMPAGLHLVIVLTGDMSVAFGDRPMRLSPPAGGSISALVALQRSERLERIDSAEGPERKLILWVAHDWLADAGLNAGRQHLHVRTWASGARLHGLAESIARTPFAEAGLSRLRTECRTIELLGEALGGGAIEPDPHPRDRMQAARELLDSGAADSWGLADIALELGLHENTLQRRFREAHGCTVFDYLRRRRLEQARAALRDGATVTDAAFAAGYGSPANFATAFKRMFGLPPSSVRSALPASG